MKLTCRGVDPDFHDQAENISSQMEKFTDLPALPSLREEQTDDNGGDLEQLYNEQNARYQTHQRQLRIREVCKLICDSTYTIEDGSLVSKCLDSLEETFKQFTSGQIISISGPKLRYKTLKQLSRPKSFKGKDVIALSAKKNRHRRNMGDLLGLLHVNAKIQKEHRSHSVQKPTLPAEEDKQSHLDEWVVDDIDFSSSDFLRRLDEAETLYLTEEKKALLSDASQDYSGNGRLDCEYKSDFPFLPM